MWLKCFSIFLRVGFVLSLIGVNIFVSGQGDEYRLSNTTKPERYEITLNVDTDCENKDFNGVVVIRLKALGKSEQITLNSKGLTIDDVELLVLDGGSAVEVTNKSPVSNENTDILTLDLSDELEIEQTYVLTIVYRGQFSDDKLGFYQSSYVNDDGETVCLASTQFAPTQARRAFPCYDEPRYKADFDIVINHPQGTIALSNEQSTVTKDGEDGKLTTIFKRVEKLPTYLVGFVISDFGSKSILRDSCDHRVYARKNSLDYVDFALEFGWKVYEHFENYFEIKLPLKQMKHIGIPDFYFSAMENWGMITYTEKRFFFNPDLHTVNLKHSISNVIGHEVTHHWFGDLVTMKWWTHVWLKEGFATLFSYYGQDAIHPEYSAVEFLIVEKLQFVFTIDSDPTIKPMSKYIVKQEDIMANYDKIAYDKACCVLRMMQNAFTADVFKNGLVNYLRKNAHSNTAEDDLFAALQESLPEEASTLNVKEIMTSWTQQSGYPVVTVTRNYADLTIHLTQERFMHTGQRDNATIWWIPINFVVRRAEEFTGVEFWLKETEAVLSCKPDTYTKLCSDEFLILNNKQTGYYRVNYDEANWNLIADALKTNHRTLHVYNRAQLIDDAFNLALVGRIDYRTVFNLIEYIVKDLDYAPWAALQRGFTRLRQYLAAEPNIARLNRYVQNLVAMPYRNIGIRDISEEQFTWKFTRQVIVSLACEFGLPDCLNEQRDYSHSNLREIYYCNRLRAGGNYMFGTLRNLLKTTREPILRSEIISVLGCSIDRIQLSVILLSTLDKTSDYKLTDDERVQLLQNVYRRSHLGLTETVNFLDTEESDFRIAFKPTDVEKIFLDLAKYINSVDLSTKFNILLPKMNLGALKESDARNIVRRNLWWIADYGGVVFKSIAARPSGNAASGVYGSVLAIVGGLIAIICY